MHGRSASLSAPRPPCPARLHPRCLPICGSVPLANTSVCTTYVCIYPHSSRFRPLLGGTCSCPCPYVTIVLALGPHLDLSTDAFSKVSVHESHRTDIPGAPDLGLEGATSLVLLGHRARGAPLLPRGPSPPPRRPAQGGQRHACRARLLSLALRLENCFSSLLQTGQRVIFCCLDLKMALGLCWPRVT